MWTDQAHPDGAPPLEVDLDAAPAERAETERASDLQWRPDGRGAAFDHRERFGARGAGDGQVTRLDDRRLLAGDLGNGVAEVLAMVEPHVRDHRDAAAPGVRGVETPAEADLDDRDVDALAPERLERGAHQELELRRRPDARLDRVGRGQGPLHRGGERERVERPPVELHPLAIAHQVRLRRGRMPDPGRGERRRDERDHAPLAVRAGHEGAAHLSLGVTELPEEGVRPLEPKPHAEAAARGERR